LPLEQWPLLPQIPILFGSAPANQITKEAAIQEMVFTSNIIIHPHDPNVVYVAAAGHLYSNNPERGLYKTTDGGKTWQLILQKEVDGRYIGVIDVVMDLTNPDILFAATYDKVRKPYTFNLGGPGSRIYKTTDGRKECSAESA